MATVAVGHGAGHAAHGGGDGHGHGHPPTTTGLDHKKVAIWAFIGSECMLFASLISTYMIYKGRSVVGPFPHQPCPAGPPPGCPVARPAILDIPVTSASTFVLLMSSLAKIGRAHV
jgi:cytochrome c oxidase subunit 3